MQTTTKKRRYTSLAAANYFGLSPQEYVSAARVSSKAEAELGLKTTAITKGPFGSGCLLKLAGARHEYELYLDGNGHALLGQVKDGKRIRLCGAPSYTQASWTQLFAALKA